MILIDGCSLSKIMKKMEGIEKKREEEERRIKRKIEWAEKRVKNFKFM